MTYMKSYNDYVRNSLDEYCFKPTNSSKPKLKDFKIIERPKVPELDGLSKKWLKQ